MSLKQFQQELSKGLPHPVYLFYSAEDFLLYEVLTALKELHGDADAFGVTVFDLKSPDDGAPMEQIVDTLNTLPFLSKRKTVVLRNVQKLTKNALKKLQGYLADPSPTTLLVMLFEGASPKLFDADSLKKVKAIGLTVQEKEIPLWITMQAKRKGVTLTGRAVEYMISATGTDLGMLSAEIEKLSNLGTTRAVDVDDLKGTIYSGADYNAFDLLDALRRGDAREVFRIFESMAKNQDPQMLLGALNYHYSRQASGHSPAKIFSLLHEADAALKTSHKYVMEELLVKLLRQPRAGAKR